ncbi:hypothetical protein [Streptosporangium sp. NPDC048865]|uniref:hypothetical protein n=1 Tax=Streptosporangium sp. NPDC048865 TaxID=3155766 RepID=UPI00343678B5
MRGLRAARGGFALGCLIAVIGVALAFGLAVALMVGGVVLAVACLVLVEVDEAPATKAEGAA